MSSYEREKVEATLEDLELAHATLHNALVLLDFASKEGIPVEGDSGLGYLRAPGGLAGPDGKLTKALDELLALARKTQEAVAARIPAERQAALGQAIKENEGKRYGKSD